MNPVLEADRTSTSARFHPLNSRIVLVKSTRDHRNPPTAMRGWLEVHESPDTAPQFSIAIEFPQMFTSRAHHRTIPLDRSALDRLLASEANGTFEFTIDDELA